MEEKKVKDLMVPIAEYATVSEDATLKEALAALEKAQKKFDDDRYAHRAIIVLNKDHQVVGKVSQHDVLKALEPKYLELCQPGVESGITRYGFDRKIFADMCTQYSLWSQPMLQLVRDAAGRPVTTFMYKPQPGEYIGEDGSLSEAIHLLVVGRHQSLLVMKDKKIVGVLRLVDLFREISNAMHQVA
ncbi:MAG: HPP family protein [Thermodesulfobacteriota bacterium]